VLGFEQPVWLWLLLLAIPVVYLALRWLGAMSLPRRWSAAVARVAFIALVAGILAGATAVRPTSRLAVIAVVDISESVRAFGALDDPELGGGGGALPALDAARRFLAAARDTDNPENLLGVVVFSGRSAAVSLPRAASGETDLTLDLPLPEGSDLAGALRFAAALIPPDAAGRLVLLSDGVQTSGDALAAASELAGESGAGETTRGAIPVDVVPLRYRIDDEVLIESVDAPPRAPSESPITVRMTLRATAPARGTLRLLHNEEPVDLDAAAPGMGRPVALEPGLNVQLATVQLDAGRVHRFEAVFEPDVAGETGAPVADSVLQNNRAEAFTIAAGRGSVLIVDGAGHAPDECPLASALRDSGLDVTLVPPEFFPGSLLELQAHDVIFLENVAADALARRSHEDLANHVRGMGGGLVMIGGRSSFGAGNWKGTDVEPLLPVKLELPESLVIPETAVVFVLDNSGSMSRPVLGSTRSQQAIANDSTALAVLSLDERDLVGVISFNADSNVVVPLGPNADATITAERVRAIPSGGGTRLGPALTEAGRQLAEVDAKVKHIIVLSDGRSQNAEVLPSIAERLATRGINLSTIAVGDEADREGMTKLAALGGGTYYEVVNPAVLPRLLLRAVRIVRSPMVREGLFEPVLAGVASPLLQGVSRPPPLLGISLTQAREDPTVTTAAFHPEGEPLLAHWPVELGRAVAFTSDADRWARDWLGWPGYQTFWTQVARWAARPADTGSFQLTTRREGDRLRLAVEAADPASLDRDTAVEATVYAPSGEPIDASLVQTGPGTFETTLPAPESGNYITVVKPRAGERPLPPVIGGASLAASPELRALESNDALLERIAAATGGRVLAIADPAAAQLFDRTGVETIRARSPLWRALLVWAIVVLMLDVGTRRIAWDRLLSREFGADLRRAAREQVEDRSARASASLSAIKGRARRAEMGQKAVSEDEVSALKAEQKAKRRERRRAELEERLSRYRSDAQRDAKNEPAVIERKRKPGADTPDSGSDEEGTSGLLAAKRRARQRYVDEDDGQSSGG